MQEREIKYTRKWLIYKGLQKSINQNCQNISKRKNMQIFGSLYSVN